MGVTAITMRVTAITMGVTAITMGVTAITMGVTVLMLPTCPYCQCIVMARDYHCRQIRAIGMQKGQTYLQKLKTSNKLRYQ